VKNGNQFKRVIRLLLSLRKKALTKNGTQKILGSFNQKVKKAGGIESVIRKFKVMYEYFRHPETSAVKKSLVGAALLYFLLPADVVVDWIPVLGYVDDVTAALFVWNLLSKELDKFEKLKTWNQAC
jgi:uncharacterized membrane protein YkvA (DUF1232 family)